MGEVSMHGNRTRNGAVAFRIVLMMLWLFVLRFADSFFMPYLLVAALSLFCLMRRWKEGYAHLQERRDRRIVYGAAVLFVCIITAANYRLWKFPTIPEWLEGIPVLLCRIVIGLILAGGSWVVFENIFVYMADEGEKLQWREDSNWKPWKVFLSCFLLVAAVDLFFLYFSKYPGVLTYDNIYQIEQVISGEYTNHHPFYHTQLIRLWLTIGMRLSGGDINVGVWTYSVFQITVMALCFSSAVMTLAEMKAPKWMIIGSIVFYVVMPFHIEFSYTLWKDVLFGGMVLLFCVYLIRIILGIGRRGPNYVIFCIADFGFCLLRSNGIWAFLLLFLILIGICRKKHKSILLTMGAAAVICMVLTNPVLNALSVKPVRLGEALSIPAQQIAKVIAQENDLTEEEYELLSEIVDVDLVPVTYWEGHSDSIKDLIVDRDNERAIRERTWEYVKLYLTLGFRHPIAYLEAWIEQTRGYWNSGYDYWHWGDGVFENDLGILHTANNEQIDHLLNAYLLFFETNGILHIFVSIGFTIWIYIGAYVLCRLKKDYNGLLTTLPVLLINLTLLLGTPVFSEFRYIYSAFCILPFTLTVVTRPDRQVYQ